MDISLHNATSKKLTNQNSCSTNKEPANEFTKSIMQVSPQSSSNQPIANNCSKPTATINYPDSFYYTYLLMCRLIDFEIEHLPAIEKALLKTDWKTTLIKHLKNSWEEIKKNSANTTSIMCVTSKEKNRGMDADKAGTDEIDSVAKKNKHVKFNFDPIDPITAASTDEMYELLGDEINDKENDTEKKLYSSSNLNSSYSENYQTKKNQLSQEEGNKIADEKYKDKLSHLIGKNEMKFLSAEDELILRIASQREPKTYGLTKKHPKQELIDDTEKLSPKKVSIKNFIKAFINTALPQTDSKKILIIDSDLEQLFKDRRSLEKTLNDAVHRII